MLITEEEAKTRWCPYSRVLIENQGDGSYDAGNRWQIEGPPPINSKCLGSICMAWRFEQEGSTHGYCGLAGKPE